jgi:hypothetical protein
MSNETKADSAVEALVNQAVIDAELANNYNLVAVRAYVKDDEKARAKNKNAERQAKFVAEKTAQGLVKDYVPASIAAQVKEAGGWESWLALMQKAQSAPLPTVPVPCVQSVDLPGPAVSPVSSEAEVIGQRVKALGGARGWLIRRLLAV